MSMPDSRVADAAALFIRRPDLPVELTGRSPAITRVQELVRRAARLDGGALITAEPGAAVDDVARDRHLRIGAASGATAVLFCARAAPAIDGRAEVRPPAHRAPADL